MFAWVLGVIRILYVVAVVVVVAGVGCAFAGLCYAEFSAMIPVSGSAYSYSYATLGEGVAWFIGWNLILEYLFAAGTVAVGWSGYVVSLIEQLGFHLPDALTNAPFGKGATHWSFVRTGALEERCRCRRAVGQDGEQQVGGVFTSGEFVGPPHPAVAAFAPSTSPSRQMRCIIVGTWYSHWPRCRSIIRSVPAASKRGVMTT